MPDKNISGSEDVLSSEEAEKALLSSIVYDNLSLKDIIEVLPYSYISSKKGQLVLKTMYSFYDRRESFDYIALREELKKNGLYEEVGESFIKELSDIKPDLFKNSDVEIIRDRALRRKLEEIAKKISSDVRIPEKSVLEILLNAEKELYNTSQEISIVKSYSANDLTRSLFEQIKDVGRKPCLSLLRGYYDNSIEREQEKLDCKFIGISTGFKVLDSGSRVLHPSSLTIIGGDSGAGKTSLARNIMIELAINQKKPIAFFDFECSAEQTMLAMQCSFGNLNYENVKKGRMTQDEHLKFLEIAHIFHKAPIYIYENVNLPVRNPWLLSQ